MPSKKSRQRTLVIAGIIIGCATLILLVILAIVRTRETQTATEAEASTPGQVSVDLGLSEREKWPIIDNLPLKNSLYTIGYTIKDDELIIYLDTTDTNLETALEKLATLTDQPLSSLNIEITNPKNPFAGRFQGSSSSDPLEFLRQGYPDIAFNITSSVESGENYLVYLTTGSEEAYNLVHYTAVLKSTGDGWELATEPTPSLLFGR